MTNEQLAALLTHIARSLSQEISRVEESLIEDDAVPYQTIPGLYGNHHVAAPIFDNLKEQVESIHLMVDKLRPTT